MCCVSVKVGTAEVGCDVCWEVVAVGEMMFQGEFEISKAGVVAGWEEGEV